VGASGIATGLRLPATASLAMPGVMGSETGVGCPRGKPIIEKVARPGQMLAVDLERRFAEEWQVKGRGWRPRHPDGGLAPGATPQPSGPAWQDAKSMGEPICSSHQTAFFRAARPRISILVTRTWAGQGKEPTYCMGDDIPWRCFFQPSPTSSTTTSKQRLPRSQSADRRSRRAVMSLEMPSWAAAAQPSARNPPPPSVLHSIAACSTELWNWPLAGSGPSPPQLVDPFSFGTVPADWSRRLQQLWRRLGSRVREGGPILVL